MTFGPSFKLAMRLKPSTERESTRRPLDATPMHPEYPCAHCIQSAAAAGVIEAVLGSQEQALESQH
jgi:hypothetical protein